MTNCMIQEYKSEYKEELIRMILAIQQDEYKIPISRENQPDLADIPEFYQKANGNFWVALHSGNVVGTIGLIDIGNQQVALRKMFVKAAYRGNQSGIARMLLEKAVTWSAKHGVKFIYLGTTDKFKAAHRFYEKNGFTIMEKRELPPEFPVMQVDTVFYRLAVNQEFI